MSSIVIAMVGPAGLKDAYSVLLRSALSVDTFVYADRPQALYELRNTLAPDLIILHVTRSHAECQPGQLSISELQKLLAMWPRVVSIVVLDDPRLRQEMEPMGVDLALIEGIPPTRLLKRIEALLAERERDRETHNRLRLGTAADESR